MFSTVWYIFLFEKFNEYLINKDLIIISILNYDAHFLRFLQVNIFIKLYDYFWIIGRY